MKMRPAYFLLTPLAMAFEIAFSNYDLENDLRDEFPTLPIPDFNWSVYPRYRCNVVNDSGLKWKTGYSKYVRDVLVRTLPGGDGPPDIIVLFEAVPIGFSNPEDHDFNDPCAWKNARGIIRFKDAVTNYLSRGVGNSQKYNAFGVNHPTHWRELGPNDVLPEEMATLVDLLEPGRTAVWWGPRKGWDIPYPDGRGIPSQRGDIHSGGYFTDYWYLFSEFGASLLLGEDDTDPDASEGGDYDNYDDGNSGSGDDGIEDENLENNGNNDNGSIASSPRPSSSDEVASLATDFSVDQAGYHEFIEREDYPWQPPAPQIIRNNTRWILHRTVQDPTINPYYRRWRNARITEAGDYRPIATISEDGVEDMIAGVPLDRLIAEGWIIDKQAEARYQEKLRRERLGVREAEIFYELLTNAEESKVLDQNVYDKIWEMEDPGWKPSDPLQLLMSIDTDGNKMILEEQQGNENGVPATDQNQINVVQPQSPVPNPLARQIAFRPPVDNQIHDFLSGPGSPI
ncbi:hypothetical protein TWF718_009456 [Orbilia javanica]|uniref:Uncharacterized protein n=1 Tax=Orbilia javanica TaxID=47235 RepID=A0AAN8MZ89_9PEZI